LTKTIKTLAVMQGQWPLFLLRPRLAPKQASASRSRRRNNLRSSGLHHSKKNRENRLTQKEKSEELRVNGDEFFSLFTHLYSHFTALASFKGFSLCQRQGLYSFFLKKDGICQS
jgi:hypothetical protein